MLEASSFADHERKGGRQDRLRARAGLEEGPTADLSPSSDVRVPIDLDFLDIYDIC